MDNDRYSIGVGGQAAASRWRASSSRLAWLVLLITLCWLASTAHAQQLAAEPSGKRIAAQVNGAEISLAEVDLLYRRSAAPDTPPAAAAAQRRAILEQLVHTELMAQRAVSMGMDTNPDLKVEARLQRRQALARLFEAKAVTLIPGTTAEMVRQTIADNPLVFAQRHAIEFDQVQLAPADKALLKKLDGEAAKGASLERLIEIAQEAGAKPRRVLRKHSTESIPPILARAMLASKPGRPITAILDERSGILLTVRSATPTPLIGQAAEKAAAALLNRQRSRAGLESFRTQFAKTASINYYGEFAAGAQPLPADSAALKDETADATGPETLGLALDAVPLRGTPIALTAASALLVLASVTLAVLLLLTSLRWIRGEFWLPRLRFWRQQTQPELLVSTPVATPPMSDDDAPELPSETLQEAERAGLLGHLFLLSWVGASLALLGWQLFMVWQRLPWWLLSLATLTGLLLGAVASHGFAQSNLRLWQRQRIWWQPLLFGSLLLVNAFIGGLLAALR